MVEDLCLVSSNSQFSDLSFERSFFIALSVAIWKHSATWGLDPRLRWGSWCFLWLSEEQWHRMSRVSNSWVGTTLTGFVPPSPPPKTWLTVPCNLCKCHPLTVNSVWTLSVSSPRGLLQTKEKTGAAWSWMRPLSFENWKISRHITFSCTIWKNYHISIPRIHFYTQTLRQESVFIHEPAPTKFS